MTWLSRSLPMLILGLVVLALGLFIEWPGDWSYLFGFAGVLLLIAWAIGFPRSRAGERRGKVERRQSGAARRQRVTEVEFERRYTGERRAAPR
jgi:hypothetical protein